jgi:P-type Ca2+ transporter type 2C
MSDKVSSVDGEMTTNGALTMTHITDAYHLDASEVVHRLGSDPLRGLSVDEAKRRLSKYGPNELEAAHAITPWGILFDQLKNILILILLIAVGLSAFLGHAVEAIAIAIIVCFAVLLGFYQEYRAERAIEALGQMAAPTATVLRDGQEIEVAARETVPGDIVLLRTGDKVPADGRLIEAMNLQVEEAALTGESVPVAKRTSPLDGSELALGDRKNMVYAGTAITYGRGRAVVVATGMTTEFGKIARLLATVKSTKTPLQENLDKLGGVFAQTAFGVVLLIILLGVIRGRPVLEMFIFGIALAVAVVPEALPAVVTISLAIGVQRMVKRNALIRRLPAVETLGSVSVICSDKTGTLTKDEMTARKIFVAGQMLNVSGAGYEPSGDFSASGSVIAPAAPLLRLLEAAVLASDAHLARASVQPGSASSGWEIKGDPTEGALIVAAAKAGVWKTDLDAKWPRVSEIPFTAESKRMTTLHDAQNGLVAYAKGAPEVILDSCATYCGESDEIILSLDAKTAILTNAREMAEQALRVLAVAYKPDATLQDAERGMIFLGLVGMIDPPRPEAKAAIRSCEAAGIEPIMITGDHPITAQAIGRELGLLTKGRVITGAELEAMSEEEFQRNVEDIEIYARVSPAHKLRVVTALQQRGHYVAMTGDGVNDAPALKKADIGIAMGITGTDVSKEAAAMMLTDDNFASIVAAVEEGRAVFDNIKKYLMYLLSTNLGEIALMLSTAVMGLPLPLSAVQILYVNLASDGLPALALAVDPAEPDLMRRPPRDPRRGIFTRPVIVLILLGGIWSGIVNLSLFSWALGSGRSLSEAMTMTFVSLVLIQFVKAYNYRSDRYSVLKRPFANKWLNWAISWEIMLLASVVYAPFLREPFGTFSLPLIDWIIVIGMALSVAPVLEAAKWMERRGWLGKMS